MLIGISGPSSSGKGTLLRDLESTGFQVFHHQYARTLLREQKLSIDTLYRKSFNEIKYFHIQLVKDKDKHEREFIHTATPVFVERTFIDFYVYLTTQTGVKDLEFKELCVAKTHEFYNSIIYLEHCPIVEDDGIRVIDEDLINTQKRLFTSIWSSPEFLDKHLSIPYTTRADRITTLISYIKGL